MDSFSVGTVVGGRYVETVCAEQGAGEPLLLLHGWGASRHLWRNFWPAAVPRFRCLAPDLPGFGDSDQPDVSYSPEWYADWVAALLDARYAPAAHIVGHSMGAMISAVFALKYPGRVRRLVLSNPPVDGATAFSARTYRLSQPFIRRLLHFFFRFRTVRRWVARDFTRLVPWNDQDVDAMGQAGYEAMIRSIRGMMRTNLRPRLPSLRAPTLVLGSGYDRVVTLEQAEAAVQGIPGAEYRVLAESGHCPMLEVPDRFNYLLLEFLGNGHWRPPQW